MANGTIAVTYTGAGAFLYDVPARDMTKDEWEALGPEMQQTALALDLYQLVKPAKIGTALAVHAKQEEVS